MSSSSNSYTEEPKKIYLAFLLDRFKVANFFLFIQAMDARGWDIMIGIIYSLSEDSQKALTNITKELSDAIMKKGKLTTTRTREIYGELFVYCNKVYFAECNFGATIPTSALKKVVDAPPEVTATRLKAGL